MATNINEIRNFLEKELGPLVEYDTLILLTGSRALGFEQKDSDYDCYLIVNEKIQEKAKKYFIQKGWCTEMQGPWTNLKAPDGNQLTLILKHYGQFEHERDPERHFIFTKAKVVLGSSLSFKKLLGLLEPNINQKNALKQNYLTTKLAMRMVESMYRRKDTVQIALIKKGDTIRALMKTVILIDKQLPPYEKWLYKLFLTTKNAPKAKRILVKIEKIKTLEEAEKTRVQLFDCLDKIMPQEAYVGKNWWQYLP